MAAAYANLLYQRDDIAYAVAHPCHPSVFLERTTTGRRQGSVRQGRELGELLAVRVVSSPSHRHGANGSSLPSQRLASA